MLTAAAAVVAALFTSAPAQASAPAPAAASQPGWSATTTAAGATILTPAAVPTASTQVAGTPWANCWGSYTIYPDGWGFMYGAASTNCTTQASVLHVVVYIRVRDPFGYVGSCGTYDVADAFFATTVTANTSCIENGAGYTYWIYSEHSADIDGQHIAFTGGSWDYPA